MQIGLFEQHFLKKECREWCLRSSFVEKDCLFTIVVACKLDLFVTSDIQGLRYCAMK